MREVQALVSVRSVDEARAAADAGVRLIDLKEPRTGALGALPSHRLGPIVAALRGRPVEISATVGDAPIDVLAEVQRVAACGVDGVKVGVASPTVLARLRALPHRIVPVLLADLGLDDALVEAACRDFDTVMLDTVDKASGSLFDVVPIAALRRFVEHAHRHGRRAGLAGALRLADLPRLRELQPDFAGFRSAVCDGDRTGALNARCLRELLAALRGATLQPA